MEEPTLFKTVAEGLIYLTTLILTIYSVILGYHWFTYGASRKKTMTALIVFVSGCAAIIVGLVVTFQFI